MAKRLSKRAKRRKKEAKRQQRRERRRAQRFPEYMPVDPISLDQMAGLLHCTEEEAAETMDVLFEIGILRPDGHGGVEMLAR